MIKVESFTLCLHDVTHYKYIKITIIVYFYVNFITKVNEKKKKKKKFIVKV